MRTMSRKEIILRLAWEMCTAYEMSLGIPDEMCIELEPALYAGTTEKYLFDKPCPICEATPGFNFTTTHFSTDQPMLHCLTRFRVICPSCLLTYGPSPINTKEERALQLHTLLHHWNHRLPLGKQKGEKHE